MIKKTLLALLVVGLTACSNAEQVNKAGLTPEKNTASSTYSSMLPSGTTVVSEKPLDMFGGQLIEVVTSNKDVFYASKDGKFIVVGNVIDLNTKKNLTKDKMAEVTKIDFASLPKSQAIVEKVGDGSREIAVFVDANCGYCKKFEKELIGLTNVTIYRYMVAFLSPDSSVKANNIWCSNDKLKAWKDWANMGIVPAEAPACDTPTQAVSEFAHNNKITGTPTTILKDGSRIGGYVELVELNAEIESASKTK